MSNEDIFKIAIECGLANNDLSKNGKLVTDYGDATESILEFAAIIQKKECSEWMTLIRNKFLAKKC